MYRAKRYKSGLVTKWLVVKETHNEVYDKVEEKIMCICTYKKEAQEIALALNYRKDELDKFKKQVEKDKKFEDSFK
jgi:hypothetical protein